jgi:hypothetical protein
MEVLVQNTNPKSSRLRAVLSNAIPILGKSWELPVLAVTVAVMVGVIVLFGMLWRDPQPLHNDTNPLVTYELGDERIGEYMRQHFRRNDRSMLKTLITYRNGDLGTVNYRTDSTFRDFTVVAQDGTHVRETSYDITGKKVVKGFELRSDRTRLWQTETLANGTVKTVVFWRDGKQPFSVRLVNEKDNTTDFTYFRQDGKMWVHQWFVGSYYRQGEDLYSEKTGLLERTYRRPKDRSSAEEVTYYGANGVPAFKLTWVTTSSEHSYSVDLSNTVVFNADGQTPALTISWVWGSKPDSIMVPNPDGTRVVNHYGTKGEPLAQRLVAKDGTQISSTEKGADLSLLARVKPEYYVQTRPEPVDPVPVWKEAEAKSP